MASINDLATAATIASSAVALQASPQQHPASQSSPPPQAPLTPSTAATAAAVAAAAVASESTPTTSAQAAQAAAAAVAAAIQPTPPPPPAAGGSSSSSVLAAPQTSPPNPQLAQIPAPASPPAQPAGSSSTGAPSGGATDGEAGGSSAAAALPERRKPVRGALVVFEGMDRAGKTTQAKLLQQRCIEEGKDVKFMRFPDRTTPIGQMIDSYLKGQAEIEDHVIHLLFSANRWEAVKTIRTALAAGTSVICDRYYHSGIVYSAAKQLPSLTLAWAKAPEVGLPRPDVVLFLDLEEKVARERGGWGGEIYEKGEMQRRVRELFWGLSMGDVRDAARRRDSGPVVAAGAAGGAAVPGAAARENGLKPDGEVGQFRQEEEDLVIVDAALGVEELAEKVWENVLPRLEAVEKGEVGDVVRTVR